MPPESTSQVTDKTQGAEPKTTSLGSRFGLAAAFAFVGAKLGTLGIIQDANKLYSGEPVSLGEKIRGAFNGTLREKMMKRIEQENPANAMEAMKASGKLFKHTIIWTAVAASAGSVLGWVRGGRIEHPKDIIVHPIKSLKIALGPAPKESEAPMADNTTASPDSSKRWQDSAAKSKTETVPSR